jgi:predicted PurR-regulated permease PerM
MKTSGMNFAQWMGLVVFVIALYILWEIRQLLLLLFIAVIFAAALNRLVHRLQRSGIKRGLAIALSVGGTITFLVITVALIVPPFIDQFQELIQLLPQGFSQLEARITELAGQLPGNITEFIPTFDNVIAQIQPLTTTLANNFFRLFSDFFNVTVSTLLTFVLTLMLALNPHPYRRGFIRLVPSFYRRRADEILTLCEDDLMGWIIGTLITMVVVGITSGIILSVLGVRLVFANALLAALLEAIPNLGPTLATIFPATIALVDAPWKAAAVIVAYALMQQLESFLLVPMVMGQQLSLLPAVTLLAQIVFASFFGFLGLFLAVPLLIIVRVMVQEILVKDVLDQWQDAPVTMVTGSMAREGGGDRTSTLHDDQSILIIPSTTSSDFPSEPTPNNPDLPSSPSA